MQRFILTLFAAAILAAGQTVPSIDIKALDGTPVVIPDASKPTLILLGFSHKSSGDLEAWNKLCTKQYWRDARLNYYELVDLQGLPFFVKPMVLHGMRKVIQGDELSHFAPFYNNEKTWKQLAAYQQPSLQYVLLVDTKGAVVWRTTGPASPEQCTALAEAIAKFSSP